MATITFLSPRRGSGTTTAVAAAASSLTESNAKVEIIDRTANEDFTRWFPNPPTPPERIESTYTLIDAHEPRPEDELVFVVYDSLTEPNPSLWLSALLAEHPHLVIIGGIVNRTNESPGTLDVPGRPTVRVKPLPLHHLFHDAAKQHLWPLEISALSQQHVRIPTIALSPHIIVSVLAAAEFPPITTPAQPDEPETDEPDTDEPELDVIDISDSADMQPDNSIDIVDEPIPESQDPDSEQPSTLLDDLDDLDADLEPTIRKGFSVPTPYRDAMMALEPSDRRRRLSSLVDTHLSTVKECDPDDPAKRVRLFSAWATSDTDAIAEAARERRCKEWQIVTALLAIEFDGPPNPS